MGGASLGEVLGSTCELQARAGSSGLLGRTRAGGGGMHAAGAAKVDEVGETDVSSGGAALRLQGVADRGTVSLPQSAAWRQTQAVKA